MADAEKPYPSVDPQASFPGLEEGVLARWARENTFRKSVEQRPAGVHGANEYVFYDGPPFANGRIHYGHLVTGYVKDIVPRYQTMRGRRVERRFGWDCHGLPAEMEAEKELSVSGRMAIQEYGIGKFNDHCRSSVLRYTKEWETLVTRQARWADFRNDYKTMDLPYMESVIWAFKELYKRGLIYEGYKVVPYSWACETVLSHFETRLDDSYRDRQDPAITVRFTLEPEGGKPALSLLVWTTTPWTLPSNLALAVGADIEYALFDLNGETVALAAGTVAKHESLLACATPKGTIFGRDLAGRKYRPLFPYFASAKNAFRVLTGSFVSTDEGTGVVHMAPGFGEDDQMLCEANDIAIVCPVDHRGRFTNEVPDYAGQLVFDANKPIIRDLKERGVLLKHDTYVHSYPHCWRTDQPLIYRAVSSWYVRVTAFRARMVELNRDINWIPEHVKDGTFGKWLEGARDWAISRNRFWGTPLPVWKSDDPRHPRVDVYGSLEEIARDFGKPPADLHRPGIDLLTRPNPDDPTGKSVMRRVEDVFDCWFESGSMPYAQVHYPFENKEWFEHHFPADFIVEYIAQTRGWFYTLMVLSTALFDRPPFRNCICHGIVLDESGRKLSKRLRNYPAPEDVFARIGADALRWYMTASPVLRGQNLSIDREGRGIAEVARLVLKPLWNAYSFFTLYANADGVRAKEARNPAQLLDRYILAKTRELVEGVTRELDRYEIAAACAHAAAFIDALNNWYIRRSRERFWREAKDADKLDAYNTLYTVLTTVCRVLAPLLPLLTEEIYRGLTRAESVHLADWPDANELPDDPALVKSMDMVREICTSAHSLRKAKNLRVRLPLATLTIASKGAERLAPHFDLIRDEVNVKSVAVDADVTRYGEFKLQVNAAVVGPRVGREMQKVMAAARAGDWTLAPDRSVRIAGQVLSPTEYTHTLKLKDGITGQAIGDSALPDNQSIVVLDTAVTPELAEEGLARDVVRLIQQTRKDAQFHVSDRIHLWIDGGARVRKAAEAHRGYLMAETLATELKFGAAPAEAERVAEENMDGDAMKIAVLRAPVRA